MVVETAIESPATVWRTAFESRFRNTCSSAPASPSTYASGVVSSLHVRSPSTRQRSTVASASALTSTVRALAALARAGPGQAQQAVDELAHPVELADRHAHRLPQLGRAAVGRQRHLEVSAGDRERRAQLVRRVVHELALGGERDLEPFEHGVDRGRDLADLVVCGHRPHPHRQVAGRHPRGALGDPRERP